MSTVKTPAPGNAPENTPESPIAETTLAPTPSRSNPPHPDSPDPHEHKTAGQLIELIADRKLNPAHLSPARRQDCVHHLMHMGLTNDEIARALRVTDRTISRDRQAIRKNHALTITAGMSSKFQVPGSKLGQPAPANPACEPPNSEPASPSNLELGTCNLEPGSTTPAELLGEFQSIALASIQRMTLLARDPQTPASIRLSAEEAITRTYQKLIATAERLGAIPPPLAPKERPSHDLLPNPSRPRRELPQAAATLLIAINTVDGAAVQKDAERQTIEIPRLESQP